ncbi:serine/threonine-protein phosphatase [Glycomyces sp. L485]|uniref:PP2C family protein-serine/threonine phosphatase n=1 Tax=Glycomyces sp. L485 TaxID=2909235 RepID=UPI001F4AF7B2|nr:PP2C family protein-serine/threonine phosphatase [Glycomyces sp. L485]MCH7232709.1 serine/threonine-protein phosphatase [Glycomyces sp. L485]
MSPRVLDDDALKPGHVPGWLRLLPIVALLQIAVLQVAAPDPVHIGFATAVVPLLAAFVLGPVWTSIIAVTVTGLAAAPIPQSDQLDGGDVLAVATVCAVSIGISWVRGRYQARMVTIESVAEAAQRAVLPDLPEHVGALTCAGRYHSAQRGARVGGDLFDIRNSPFGIRMILGDVQGHGLPAVSTAATVLASFHEAILDEPDLEHVAARLERRVVLDADEGYIPELFASVLLIEFSEESQDIRLLSCGHPSPLLLRGDRVEEVDLKPGRVLGLRLEGNERPLAETTLPFRADEMLLAYSDGLTEARDADGRYYPLAEHLRGLVVPPSPQRLIDFVWDDLARFVVKLDDDVSLVAVARTGRARGRTDLV